MTGTRLLTNGFRNYNCLRRVFILASSEKLIQPIVKDFRYSRREKVSFNVFTILPLHVSSVTFSSMSPITLPSSHDVSSELLQLEGKTKQLQTLQVPIPVGEVSPVSLKRSPGPAIHSGLPPVLPIIGPGIKSQGAVSSHPVVRSGLKSLSQTAIAKSVLMECG